MFSRKQRILLATIPPILALVIRTLGRTLKVRQSCAPNTREGHLIPGPTIFAFWHCSLLACAYHFRNRKIAIVISRSFDGELIARIVERLGFIPIRGSSSKGGGEALLAMVRAYKAGHICAFAADGPRGPARVSKPGVVHLAELTGATWIGAFHAQPDRAWVLNSWDRFIIPKPFSTVTIAWPEHVAPSLDAVTASINQAVAMAQQAIAANR